MSGDKSWLTRFRSMKTGLVLVLVIILASIAGTILPQQQGLHGSAGKWFNLLQLDDVFHSWWYATLLTLAALNLMACSFYRLTTIARCDKGPRPLLECKQVSQLKQQVGFSITGHCTEHGDSIIRLLRGRGYDTWSDRPVAGKYRIGAEHGRLHRWGSVITHGGFLIIMLGVLIGSVFGFQSGINVPVGAVFGLDSIPGTGVAPGTEGFKLQVNDFLIERYADSSPAGYFSRVSIIADGGVQQTATIGVNSPFKYQGIKFYQASYGEAIRVSIDGADGNVIRLGLILPGQRFSIPGTEYSLVAYASESEMPAANSDANTVADNPVPGTELVYAVFKGGQHLSMGKARFETPISIGEQGNTVQFVGTVPYTGLLVKKDPGVPLIWLGSFFLLTGMGMSFFLNPHRLWIVLKQEGASVQVLIGGITGKNQLMLAESIETISQAIQRGTGTVNQKMTSESEEALFNGNI